MHKLSVGIFGDSFAAPADRHVTPGWPEILTDNYTVTNYARRGSSLYWSYKNFIEYEDNFDITIFVVTQPGRISLAEDVVPPGGSGMNLMHVAANRIEDSLVRIAEMRKLNNDSIWKSWEKIYNCVKMYYTYVHDRERGELFHNMIVNKLTEFNDNIIIPAFPIHRDEPCMRDIYRLENEAWNIDSTTLDSMYHDKRNCHMTYDNNKIFAEMLDTYIKSDRKNAFKINIDKFVTLDINSLPLYLKKL